MAYIYKITNKINNKIYIGKTERDIEKRFKEHCNNAFKENIENRPLYAAMRKYGIENFYITLIEETESPEQREIFWIEQLQSFKYGYNATHGGDGRKYIDYAPLVELYKKGFSMHKVAEIMKCDFRTVERALNSVNILSDERIKLGHQKTYKAVAKIDKNTKQILEIFNSVSEAERKNPTGKHIGQVCLGKRKTAGGFIWKYVEKINENE